MRAVIILVAASAWLASAQYALSGQSIGAAKELEVRVSPTTSVAEGTKVSGAACTPDHQTCLLVGDEFRYALTFQVSDETVELKDRVFMLPKRDLGGEKLKEADAEGVAYSDGFFYLTGSHGRNKAGEKQSSRYFVYRVPVKAISGGGDVGNENEVSSAVERSGGIADLLDRNTALAKANGLAPEQGGTNIEGIAVLSQSIYVGFRGPLEGGAAIIGETNLSAAIGSGGKSSLTLHSVKLGNGQGVRDLVALGHKLLVLSGPQDRQGGKAAVFEWSPGKDPIELAELKPAGSPDRQPETIMVLSQSQDNVRLLVFDDGDEPKQPRIYEVPLGR